MRMAVLSFIGMVFFTSAAAFPTTPLPSSNWPQHCAYGVLYNDVVVEPSVEDAVEKAKDSFEIPLTGTSDGCEYGPLNMSALQLQPMRRGFCICSDGDEDSFCVLYNASVSVSVPWKFAISASNATKALNGTLSANFQIAAVMVRFRLVNGEDRRLCVPSVAVSLSAHSYKYTMESVLPYEPFPSCSHDREEYEQLAARAYDSVYAWLYEQIRALSETICFNLV